MKNFNFLSLLVSSVCYHLVFFLFIVKYKNNITRKYNLEIIKNIDYL